MVALGGAQGVHIGVNGVQITSRRVLPLPAALTSKTKLSSTWRARALRCTATAKVDTSETITLGKSGVEVATVGVGAWSWGDRTQYWGYNSYGNYGDKELRETYQALVDKLPANTMIDTAEAYGFGKSEELIASFRKATNTKPVIATKFAPLPWRFTSASVIGALEASLNRLEQQSLELYMIHWPGFPIINNWATNAFVEGLGQAQRRGLARAVGVSNFSQRRVREAARILSDVGVPLASNQVQYSLLYRKPEKNGLLDACKEMGVTLVAYSPLAQGLLTGKYNLSTRPGGPRAAVFTDSRLRGVEPLVGLMREVGAGHGGKTPAQVAINWVICKGALPIPGAKSPQQVEQIAGALGWRLTAEEVAALDRQVDKLNLDTLGAPFEDW